MSVKKQCILIKHYLNYMLTICERHSIVYQLNLCLSDIYALFNNTKIPMVY